jgi:uncharacterized protein involved in cysteine biosynthesis
MGLGLVIDSFFRALGQIGDRRFNKVLLLGIGLALLLLFAVTAGVGWLVSAMVGDSISIFGYELTWLSTILTVGSVFGMLALSVFLMVPVAAAMASLFLDQVAQAVEDKHYPHLPQAPPVPFSDSMQDAARFFGVIVAANLVATILCLFLLPLAPFIFWGMNGYLLGREYFTVAAMRRVGRENAYRLRARHSGTIWMAGILMAIPLSIPLVNLLIPILGAATFTHIFHATQDTRVSEGV